jgi:ADP-L-glycero-D-manno-heptose 6-epimerase
LHLFLGEAVTLWSFFNHIKYRFSETNMIIVTGAAGFIGSCLITRLNQDKFNFIIAVDDFSSPEKKAYLADKKIQEFVDRERFFEWLDRNQAEVEFCFHLGARTDHYEWDNVVFEKLNLNFSKNLWQKCHQYQIPMIYASSAATYGNGEVGFDDNETIIKSLKPKNLYGQSKHDFDLWALQQTEKPFFWAGLKMFDVYGPNEAHKERMSSVIYRVSEQIRKGETVTLFASENPDYQNGEQKRDFIYIKDVMEVCVFLMHHRRNSGIYNVGTTQAHSFNDMVEVVAKTLGKSTEIDFIPIPEALRVSYQYLTQANINKLRSIGYQRAFTTLEEGVSEYIHSYILPRKHF